MVLYREHELCLIVLVFRLFLLSIVRLTEDLLPLAVECLNRLITDKRTPAGAAFNAAKYVIDRGLGAVDNMDKEPHEMSPDELAKQIQQLRDEAAKRSGKIIDVTPVDITPQSAGIFD